MPDAASTLENGTAHKSPQEKTLISFDHDDPDNPHNWSRGSKLWIVLLGTLTVLNSTVASSLPSGDSPALQAHFGIHSQAQLVLPNSIYLVGYVLGPFLFAPLSEQYGRRLIVITTFAAFTIFIMATALAPNWPAFIIFRLLCGTFGSTPISIVGGLYADIYHNAKPRGRAMAWYLAVASMGPGCGPIPSGYLSEYGWQYPFWFGLAVAGVCLVPLLFLPETYGPAMLMHRAQKLRKSQPGLQVYAPLELKQTGAKQFASRVLLRPLRMLVTEPIVTACCLYLSLIYAVIFMQFQAFPIIFKPIYNFTEGQTGLAFLPFIVGSFMAVPVCFYWDNVLFASKAKGRPWSSREEYQRLPLAVIGGPLFTAGMFWIGWAARPDVHWVVPMLGGMPLGIGFVLVFVALFNYLVDSYKIFSASALGATSISRSTFGVVLPFATRPMYDSLGVAWACSLLGFASLAMCLIPVVFIRYGDRLRQRSPMCQELANEMAQSSERRQETNSISK